MVEGLWGVAAWNLVVVLVPSTLSPSLPLPLFVLAEKKESPPDDDIFAASSLKNKPAAKKTEVSSVGPDTHTHTHTHTPVSYTHLTLPTRMVV